MIWVALIFAYLAAGWVVSFRPRWILVAWDALKRIVRAGGGPYRALQEGVMTAERARRHGHPEWRGHIGFMSPSQPVRPLEAWTPAERDALGINDTEKWILETDRILGQIEWERTVARMAPVTPNRIAVGTGVIDGSRIVAGTFQFGHLPDGSVRAIFGRPDERKVTYSLGNSDQGEAVFE